MYGFMLGIYTVWVFGVWNFLCISWIPQYVCCCIQNKHEQFQPLDVTKIVAFSKNFWVMRHCGLCKISPCRTVSLSRQTPCTNNVWKVWHYVRHSVQCKPSPCETFWVLCQTCPTWLAYFVNTEMDFLIPQICVAFSMEYWIVGYELCIPQGMRWG